jgi:hypothetical protein
MRITFRRFPGQAVAYSVIERDDGVVYHMRELTRSGNALPHDLRHLVVERELGIADGVWGGIAAGAVYQGMEHVRGHQPPPAAGRPDELHRAQRDRVLRAELLASLVEAVAVLPEPTAPRIDRLARQKLSVAGAAGLGADPAPVVALPSAAALAAAARALQVEAARWARLRPGQELGYEWRDLAPAPPPAAGPPGTSGPGTVPWPRPVPRPREPGDQRHPRHPDGRRPG